MGILVRAMGILVRAMGILLRFFASAQRPLIHRENLLCPIRSGIAFLPSPRRSPQEITHEVGQSLLKHPTFCDTWHADECDVLETLVARICYRRGMVRYPCLEIQIE